MTDERTSKQWSRVEVSDHEGQIVAIEPESLCGRDIGERERAAIESAIATLSGFIGLPDFRELYAQEAHAKMVLMERQAAPPSEVAWLIEMQFGGKAHWWYGSDFTDDASQAIRFSRSQDADQVILERGLVDATATEHMFCAGPSATKNAGYSETGETK